MTLDRISAEYCQSLLNPANKILGKAHGWLKDKLQHRNRTEKHYYSHNLVKTLKTSNLQSDCKHH